MFVRSIWNGSTIQTNLQFSTYRFPKRLHTISCKLTRRPTHFSAVSFSSETSLSWALFPKHSLARRPPIDAGMVAFLATGFDFFQRWASTCRVHPTGVRVQPHNHRIPKWGAVEGNGNNTLTAQTKTQANNPKACSLQCPSGYNI